MRRILFNWNDGSWDISSLPLLFNGVIRVSFCIFPIILNLVSLETSPEKLFWNVNLRQFLLPVWWPSVLQKEHKIVFFIPFATLLAENTEDMALEIVLLASNDDNTPFLCVATLLVHNAEDMALGIVPLASNDDNTPFLCVSRMGTSLFLDWPFTSSRLGILTSELVPFPCCAQRVPLVFDENSVEYSVFYIAIIDSSINTINNMLKRLFTSCRWHNIVSMKTKIVLSNFFVQLVQLTSPTIMSNLSNLSNLLVQLVQLFCPTY